MAGKSTITMIPIVSKLYCSQSDVLLMVRQRPKVANGGGFVVADSRQQVAFQVDGCGITGRKNEMILRDGYGNALLLIRRNGSIVQALTARRQWKGMSLEDDSHELLFTLKEPNTSCFSSNRTPVFRISVDTPTATGGSFEVRGDFPGRCCSIVDFRGDVVAQIGGKTKGMVRDLYGVEIKGGMDQAFVCGVIAVLDYIYDGSTRC